MFYPPKTALILILDNPLLPSAPPMLPTWPSHCCSYNSSNSSGMFASELFWLIRTSMWAKHPALGFYLFLQLPFLYLLTISPFLLCYLFYRDFVLLFLISSTSVPFLVLFTCLFFFNSVYNFPFSSSFTCSMLVSPTILFFMFLIRFDFITFWSHSSCYNKFVHGILSGIILTSFHHHYTL